MRYGRKSGCAILDHGIVSPAMTAAPHLALALSPAGRFHLAPDESAPALPSASASRLEKAFARGAGDGLLFLATAALSWELGPSLAFGRELARLTLATFCAL